MFNACVNKGTGFLLFIDGYTIAILPHSNSIFLFDSHSRDERGLFVSNGYSVLLKFSSLIQVENYIRMVHLAYRSNTYLYFEAQFITVTVVDDEKANILLAFTKGKDRKRHLELPAFLQRDEVKNRKREISMLPYWALHNMKKLNRKHEIGILTYWGLLSMKK